ncbi:MAG: TRAP transporter substrate-binding protein [Thermosediminibacteraceae bacterium]|nr:TRAP transporter substrate-binding protein [Thermosediminibacteraceae bacterium]
MKKAVVVLLAIMLIGISVGCGGGSEKGSAESKPKYELHAAYSTPDSEYDQHSRLFKIFKEEVEKRTNGEIKVVLHPAGELGGEREYIEMLQSGDLAFADLAASVLSGFTDALRFLDMPYLFEDGEEAYEFFKSDIAKEKLKKLEEIGLVGLALSTAGSRNFLTVKDKPINSVDDLKGLKIRVMETPMHIEAMKLFGAQPTPMAYTECYQALQTKTIDGMENQIPTYISARLYEVAPNYAIVGWFHQNHVFLASKKIMDELPEEYQQIIKEVAEDAANQVSEWTVNFDKNEGINKLKELGVNITYPDTTPMFEKAKVLKEKYKDVIGEDVLKWLEEH